MDPGPVSEALLKYDTLRGATGAYGVNNYVSDDHFAALNSRASCWYIRA
jgi:hypothetical protein